MNKKIFGGIAFFAVALVATFNLNVKQDNKDLSLLAMANVEALASESDVDIPCVSEKGATCTFRAIMADGTVKDCTIQDYRNA